MAPPSELKRETSRRNGAKSCGPITLDGKARSARNAMKHGITAQVSMEEQDLPEIVRAMAPILHAASNKRGDDPALVIGCITAAVRLERARDRSHQLLIALGEADGLDTISTLIDELSRVQGYEKRFCGQRDRIMRKVMKEG